MHTPHITAILVCVFEGSYVGRRCLHVIEPFPDKSLILPVTRLASPRQMLVGGLGCCDDSGITVHAKTITEVILERAGPVILKTFLLELQGFRLVPVMCPARTVKPEITGNDN